MPCVTCPTRDTEIMECRRRTYDGVEICTASAPGGTSNEAEHLSRNPSSLREGNGQAAFGIHVSGLKSLGTQERCEPRCKTARY
jgi:hypothetical protein